MAKVEADKAISIREAELQTDLENKNAMTRTAKLKAEILTKASVEYETKVIQALKIHIKLLVNSNFKSGA